MVPAYRHNDLQMSFANADTKYEYSLHAMNRKRTFTVYQN